MVLRHRIGVVRTPRGFPGLKCDEGCWVNILDVLIYNWIWDDGYELSLECLQEDVLAERMTRMTQLVWYEVKARKTVRFQIVGLKIKLGDLRSPTLSEVNQMTNVNVDNLIGPDQEEVWMWPDKEIVDRIKELDEKINKKILSLQRGNEDALHHPERLRPGYSERGKNENLLLGSVTFLRLTRLISIGSYFGLLRALRKVNWIARWSLCKSFYFLVAVWFTHAMLLHMAEGTNYTAALAGAQILPAAPPNTLWMSEIPKPPLPLPHHSLLQNATDIPNASLTNISNVSNTSNVSDVSDFRALSKGFSDTTYVLVNVSNLSNPKPVLFIPKMLNQSHRFGDYLSAMQYSLQHLTGDYPIVEYSILGKTVLLMGLIIGTCAVAAWTAIFSSSMVNYLANEAEDQLARAAERRMLLAIDVVLRLQRQWRRRKRAREAARARGELPEPVAQHPTSESREGLFLRIRNKARRLVLRHTATGERLMRFFQSVLVFNIALSMIHSLPEIKNHPVAEKGQVFEEMVCTVIFSFEFGLMLVAGKGRQGSHWYLFRFVDCWALLSRSKVTFSPTKRERFLGFQLCFPCL
eukprot:s2971_g6.t1